MVHLVYSNRTEDLLAELATQVRGQQVRDGALVPVQIVVPSAGVEAYIRLGIARECGIAANLEVLLLTRFAAELVAAISGARVAYADALEAMALALLLDDALLSEPDLAPVQAYVCAGDLDGMDTRRVQLAARIGRLFEEYTFSRGDMLRTWRRETTLSADVRDTECWQRRIWVAMFGEDGLVQRSASAGGPRVMPLHEAVAALQPAGDALPRVVHVFGFSHIARTFHDLFGRIAQTTDVFVYALSPCEGFWEDVDPRDPEPLQLWARPGREHVRALNAIAGFDHDDRFVDPIGDGKSGAPTLLHRLQSDILRREQVRERVDSHPGGSPALPGRGRSPDHYDESIAVLEHASMRRELEAIASEIWRLVESDASLRFDEIAVLVPEADVGSYAAQLQAVFREAYDLPHQTVGVRLSGGSRVLEAIELLLALPLGRFTRHEVLRLAVHPAVVASMDDVDPQRWVAWCDALGVVHGSNREDHEGTYIARDILNWDQGLRRLALGAFMAGDASGDRRPVELAGEQYVPHELPASELRDAAAFGVLLRSLLEDARFARDAQMSMRDWSAFLRAMVETYVAPTRGPEEEHLARSLRKLHGIRDIDLGERRVGYRVASEVARTRLGAVAGSHGGEGVVFSTLSALRPLPFRIVFACGMGEGRFPSPATEDPLDLRWSRRREGDVTTRDRDRYAFLELLICARDRLLLSYVSRDPVTGDELAPSSVVKELLHALARGYLDDVSSLRRRHPLRRWDPRYFPDLFSPRVRELGERPHLLGTMRLPEARAEARTLALRRSVESSGARVEPSEVHLRGANDRAWLALAEHLGLAALPEAAPPLDARVVVPMSALVKFLEFPLQGWARFRVGLDEMEDEDIMAREDEPFETDFRDETMLLRGVVVSAAAEGRTLEQTYDEVVHDRELRGQGPSGVFAQAERAGHLAALETWRSELQSRDIRIDAVETHRFGRAGELARAERVHDAVALDVDVVDAAGVRRVLRAEIGGRTLPLGADGAASLTLLKRREKRDDEWARAGRERGALRAFVDHAVLSASGVGPGRSHASVSVVVTPEGAVTEHVSFAPLSRDEATVWLRGVVRELLGRSHAYFLPCEAVFVRARQDPDGPLTPRLKEARDLLGHSDGPLALRSAYGPVPHPHEYPSPDEQTARAMVERRFGLFFASQVAR